MRLGRRRLLRGAPLLLGAALAGGAERPDAPIEAKLAGAAPEAVLRTRAGLLRGRRGGGVRAFLGIPYGHVPGRFRPAVSAAPWPGIRDADRFGPVAVQRLSSAASPPGSEQCLSLNVWTPDAIAGRASAAGWPVLVWVHGGANVSGAASQPIFDGARFARSGVVCVTLNYRLGVFGFLELGGAIDGRYRGCGNNGLRDQLLALRWVRDNIAAFGGDPARVTLGGESAGAKDIAALLAAPSSRGLFSRAILESGGGRTVLSLPQADAVRGRYLALLGLPPGRADRLLGLDTERLIEAQHALMLDAPSGYPLRPLVDGVLLPAMPETAVALGSAAHIPLLLGTNRDEARLFLAPGAASRPLDGHSLSNMDAGGFEAMLSRYDASMTAPDPAEIRWRAMTAEEYWIPSLRLAEAQSAAGGAVWMYRFDQRAEFGPFQGRAAHGSELPYVWDNPDDPHLAPLVAGFDAPLAARIHAAWVGFIAGGPPAAPGLPDWPRYDARRRTTMILDRASRVERDPQQAERRLWSRRFLADASR